MTMHLAETINGLYKAELIHRRGPWRNFEAVEVRHPRMGSTGSTTEGSWSPSATYRQPKPSKRYYAHAGTTGHGGINLDQTASGNPGGGFRLRF